MPMAIQDSWFDTPTMLPEYVSYKWTNMLLQTRSQKLALVLLTFAAKSIIVRPQ